MAPVTLRFLADSYTSSHVCFLSVFGGMYFYHSVYHFLPMSNATFGSSFTIRQLALAISSPRTAALRARLRQRVSLPSACGGVSGGGWSGVLVGVGAHLVCFARLLRCSVCLLGLLLCACFRLSLPLLGFFTLLQLAPCFGSCLASRGRRFALGAGGLKQSLLVGGIGPVYSLPKLCFKPFRRLSAVGFVLGWHREPHLITTLQAPFSIGYCRTHGGNHRGWTSCGDR